MSEPSQRLARQIRFIVEADRLKDVLRMVRVLESKRRENSAEHSWHITLMAIVLAEYSNAPVDLLHVVKMLLVHDIVEVDAGDTFAFADQNDKAAREEAAARRIFGMLPDDQRDEFEALWREFDARESVESKFANAMDRLLPALQNVLGGGGTWRDHEVAYEQVIKRLSPIDDGSHALWDYLTPLLEDAVARGDIRT
jgi:putative hydrolase of HD superfamily